MDRLEGLYMDEDADVHTYARPIAAKTFPTRHPCPPSVKPCLPRRAGMSHVSPIPLRRGCGRTPTRSQPRRYRTTGVHRLEYGRLGVDGTYSFFFFVVSLPCPARVNCCAVGRVLRAVSKNWAMLWQTAMLVVVVLFIFAAVGAAAFERDFALGRAVEATREDEDRDDENFNGCSTLGEVGMGAQYRKRGDARCLAVLLVLW